MVGALVSKSISGVLEFRTLLLKSQASGKIRNGVWSFVYYIKKDG